MESELIEMYIKDCMTRGFSKSTIEGYPRIINELYKFNNGNLTSIDENILIKYLNYLRTERHCSNKSIQTYFAAISSFFEYLVFIKRIEHNPVKTSSKRYLYPYKSRTPSQRRKLISVEEAARLVNSILDTRDRAIVTVLLKTGIRKHELLELDVEDVDFKNRAIILKPSAKRTNNIVYFDQETSLVLSRWLQWREKRNPKTKALFITTRNYRMKRGSIQALVEKYAMRVGLHDPKSEKIEDHFSPHCCRHWFTAHLRRAGMPGEFIMELRGDVRKDAMGVYLHIDHDELKKSYIRCIPQLGVGI